VKHHSLSYRSLVPTMMSAVLKVLNGARASALCLAVLMLGFVCPAALAQSNEWTWMSGSSAVGQSGIYNMQGSFTVGSMPGSRVGTVSWTDANGNLWIFGGGGYDANGNFGYLNDLWEFNPSLNAWAWIGGSSTVPAVNKGEPGTYGSIGIAAAGNIPAGRSGASGWTDANGNFFLFGGAGDDVNYAVNSNGNNLNDLWMYSPTSGDWMWLGGNAPSISTPAFPGDYGTPGNFNSGAYPGSLNFAAAVTDVKGNFWLFGGYGSDLTGAYGDLNDLWEYNPTTMEWAWISGSTTVESGGNYGSLRTPASGNLPCSRDSAVMWADNLGNLWLFGGFGYPPNGEGYLNDLWEFNPTTGNWVWMAGNDTMGIVIPPSGSGNAPGSGWVGIYGNSGAAATGNNPGSRILSSGWTDSSGNLWLFGGQGFDSAGTNGNLNDLWEFSPMTDEWAWMGGSDLANQPGVYQTSAGSASSGRAAVSGGANFVVDAKPATTTAARYTPGARQKAMSWKDQKGNLWLMAGSGLDSKGNTGYLNDLWKYELQPTFTLASSSGSLSVTSGTKGTINLTVASQNGFNSAVTFACSGLPAGASCTFNPTTVTPSGGTAATTTLTITAQTLSAALHRNSIPLFPGTLALGVCLFGWRRRRGVQLMLLAVTAAGLVSGCGGGSSSAPTATSNITVTATANSGAIQQTVVVKLTVD
jgi:N-acetylneuraminic acid mutarotase